MGDIQPLLDGTSIATQSERIRANFIGPSRAMQEIFSLIQRVATSDSTVLISGESGTGKELVARAIHEQSSRSANYFVPVNCGAIPSELLESEFFGHVKGAFTGASMKREGRFRLAHKGTIFLDEIGTMHPSLQVKILRVLQDSTFEPVGAAKTEQVDVRVIAATNVDLERAVADGEFREDLFYRLNVIPIHVPSLRERREDIPHLIEYFIRRFNQEKGRHITGITAEALSVLMSYGWPGNVRECENLIQRVVVLKGEGRIEREDLPPKFSMKPKAGSRGFRIPLPEDGIDFNAVIEELENELIMQALERTQGNKNRAAQLLCLNRTTLVEKLKKKKLGDFL